MSSEVISALFAMIATILLPGWFWSKCLCASADTSERLIYSAALSITLVPAVALIQVQLFGTGVTLLISVVSAVVVLLAGLVCYSLFGSAKGPSQPFAHLLAPPSSLVLIPIIGAFALVLVALMLDGVLILPPWWPLLVVSLMILSVVAYLFETRGEAPEPFRYREDNTRLQRSPFTPLTHYLLLAAVLTLVLFRSYSGPLRYDWPFPRGVDSYQHAVMIRMMLTKGNTEAFMLYPPGVHLLGAVLSRFSGLDPLRLLPIVAPALLLLPALACYALATRLWGWQYGVAAALFSGVVINGSFEYMTYARYSSLIGAEFLFVLTVALFASIYISPSIRNGVLLAIIGSSVVLYHQVGSLYEVLLVGLLSVVFVPYLLLRRQRKVLVFLFSLGLLGMLSVLYAWSTYDLPTLVGGLLTGSDSGQGGEAVAMAIGTRGPPPVPKVVELVSQPALWLGFLGALLLFVNLLRRPSTANTISFIVLSVWGLIFLVGANTKYSAFPDRFAQDLSIALALLAAFSSVVIFRSLLTSRGVAPTLVSSLAILLVSSVIAAQALPNLRLAVGPSQRGVDGRPPAQVAVAGQWLAKHNDGGKIIATPRIRYVPYRSILAMGHYTGMQTYKVQKIHRSRDIPPFGKKPLWDAQWVLHHPTGNRTEQIVKKYDVRRIVLYKDYPGVRWRAFRSHPALYQMSFENEDVVIFTPRARA